MRGFGSDNHAPIHPEIINAILDANIDHAPSYGTDSLTQDCIELFKKEFGSQTEAHFVFNGTAANVLSLRTMIKSFESCFVTDCSHLNIDECAAPEFFAGKLVPIKSQNGKFDLTDLEKKYTRLGDQHFAQPKAISITQPTELGTVYSLDELKKIIAWAKSKKLFIHIDGARFCNAIHYLDCDMQTITTNLGVDIMSFGGTKNGLMFGEAVLIFNPNLQKDFKYIRKQAAQLPSKTRYIACQFQAYLKQKIYKNISAHCHEMALYLEEKIKKNIIAINITQPVQSNAVFCLIPKNWIKQLRQQHFFYVWDENTFECRLMMSWDTQKADIDDFISLAKMLEQTQRVPQP
ncbi:MAG: threonine aldolase family protein [Pseudobdellovibrio sp.]